MLCICFDFIMIHLNYIFLFYVYDKKKHNKFSTKKNMQKIIENTEGISRIFCGDLYESFSYLFVIYV